MNRLVGLAVFVVVVCIPILASEPGQALDCSDWVFAESGLSCTVLAPRPCDDSFYCATALDKQGLPQVIDNSGRILMVRHVDTGEVCRRVSMDSPLHRLELIAFDGAEESVLGTITERCLPGHTYNRIDAIGQETWSGITNEYVGVLGFDATAGRVTLSLRSDCIQVGVSECPSDYNGGQWVAAIEGFAPLLEIFQSYEPISGPLSFIVPTHPEGLQYADFFDTYWGDLATVGDWSQAQALQCGYPTTGPSVGDYLTVEDALPSPATGRGYYYVTAVNYQGQRRYGRQANGGVLSGRDPAVLPGCNH